MECGFKMQFFLNTKKRENVFWKTTQYIKCITYRILIQKNDYIVVLV